jgi:two-component system, chemotaxis family, response regulator WspF
MRIAIVNDMLMAVEALRRVLLSAPGLEVAWIAQNGAEAVELCARDTPDLILMDMVMPVMGGVEAVRQIMARNPCAILIVTATVAGNAGSVFEALGAGAVDVVAVPTLGPEGITEGAKALLAKIKMVANLIGDHLRQRSYRVVPGHPASDSKAPSGLIVIGASAGGPGALATILSTLPTDFPAALILVQHMDTQFVHSMADWLNQQSTLPVRVAVSGDQPTGGAILIAGTSGHLILTETGVLRYTEVPRDSLYCPSIDLFFESVARNWKQKAAGLLLTGMGKDGAQGLKALRDTGVLTIAQDRASSAVYGMPGAAAKIAAAELILPLDAMSACLIEVFVHNRIYRQQTTSP